MGNRGLVYFVMQIVAIVSSLFVLVLALAGSHGKLYFASDGGKVAAIITFISILNKSN